MKERTDITKTLYAYRDFIEQQYDIVFAVNMENGEYEQVVYHRPDFYSAPERGDAAVLYDSLSELLFSTEEDIVNGFSPEAVKTFYRSSARNTLPQRVKFTHRNGARWMDIGLLKSELYPTYVFVCVKEITHDLRIWDVNAILNSVGDKYSSILSVDLTLDECHLISGGGATDVRAKRSGVANYTKFVSNLSSNAAPAYKNEINSKFSQTFLLSKYRVDGESVSVEYLDESGEHWYSISFKYIKSMLTDNVSGLLFISCIDDEIKTKRERANLFYQLFTIGHRLFLMYITIDIDEDRYFVNRFDGDKRYENLLEGRYSQNSVALFKYVPDAERRRFLSENSLEALKTRAYSGDVAERVYSCSALGKNGERKEVELIVGVGVEEGKAGAFIAVRDVTEQNKLKRVEEREKEIISMLGNDYNLAFTVDTADWRITYLKKPSLKNVFIDGDGFQETAKRLCDNYVSDEDQAYVSTMARAESVLREIKRNGYYRFTHKWKKAEKTYWLEWKIMPLPSAPNLLLGQCKNVTEEYAAEIRRIHNEEELRALKRKNYELSHDARTDSESGFGNATAFEQYKRTFLGDAKCTVAYLTVKDWFEAFAEGNVRVFSEGLRNAFPFANTFRLGGGDFIIVTDSANYKKCKETFVKFAAEKGFAYSLGEAQIENDMITAANTAYKNRKESD